MTKTFPMTMPGETAMPLIFCMFAMCPLLACGLMPVTSAGLRGYGSTGRRCAADGVVCGKWPCVVGMHTILHQAVRSLCTHRRTDRARLTFASVSVVRTTLGAAAHTKHI